MHEHRPEDKIMRKKVVQRFQIAILAGHNRNSVKIQHFVVIAAIALY